MRHTAFLLFLLPFRAAAALHPPETDAGLKVTDGSTPFLKASAKGVQIYTCKAMADDPSKFAYDAAHSEPDALLFNQKGAAIAHHFANVAPAGACDAAKNLRVRVPYTATYYFYGPAGGKY